MLLRMHTMILNHHCSCNLHCEVGNRRILAVFVYLVAFIAPFAANDLSTLSVEQPCEHLREKAVNETAITILEEECISGAIFTRLTDDDLKDLIPQVGARLSVSMVLRDLKETEIPESHSVSHDSIPIS